MIGDDVCDDMMAVAMIIMTMMMMMMTMISSCMRVCICVYACVCISLVCTGLSTAAVNIKKAKHIKARFTSFCKLSRLRYDVSSVTVHQQCSSIQLQTLGGPYAHFTKNEGVSCSLPLNALPVLTSNRFSHLLYNQLKTIHFRPNRGPGRRVKHHSDRQASSEKHF